jgi:hypothetical protein
MNNSFIVLPNALQRFCAQTHCKGVSSRGEQDTSDIESGAEGIGAFSIPNGNTLYSSLS